MRCEKKAPKIAAEIIFMASTLTATATVSVPCRVSNSFLAWLRLSFNDLTQPIDKRRVQYRIVDNTTSVWFIHCWRRLNYWSLSEIKYVCVISWSNETIILFYVLMYFSNIFFFILIAETLSWCRLCVDIAIETNEH